MNDMVWIIIVSVIAIALFGWMWRAGHLDRLRKYVALTKKELRKCSWPTWEELKGSTVLVAVALRVVGSREAVSAEC